MQNDLGIGSESKKHYTVVQSWPFLKFDNITDNQLAPWGATLLHCLLQQNSISASL